MRKFLLQNPLHTFLLIFFLSFFLFAENTDLVKLHMMKRTLILGTLVATLLFFAFYFIIKERVKAGLITTFILLALFNYGVLYDFLEGLYYKGFWPFHNIHRYSLLLMMVYIIGITWFIGKKIVIGNKINYFLNILIVSLTVFNILRVVFNQNNTNKETELVEIAKKDTSFTQRPNVYFLVLDGYANQHILKKYYNYDNKDFITFLESYNFYIADSSASNYFSTAPSLSSTLNMDYHINDNHDYVSKMRENKVFSQFQNYGYKTYRLESGYAITNGFSHVDSVISISSPNEFERSILKYSVFRLDDLFGFLPYFRLKSQIQKLDEISTIGSISPKFVFIHIVAPHPPFVFDEKGNHTFSKKDGDNSWEPKSNYLAQLKYINSVAKTFITNVISKDSSAVFLLQSDHGPWILSKNQNEIFETRSMILNATRYGTSKNVNHLTKKISSVNTFRVLFKNYFDSTITILNDMPMGKNELLGSKSFTDKILK